MMENVVIEFQRVTKFPIIKFFLDYRDFLINSYPEINSYFSGEKENIDNSHLLKLKKLTLDCRDALSQFENFSNKFDNCGYWELMEYLDGLNTNIEKINKLPKFRRTSITKRGYKPVVQVTSTVGGQRTVDDVANAVKQLNEDNTDWVELMLSNDFNEDDWEIDVLSPIDVLVNNTTDVVVTTILDMPIGERVYGIDLCRVLSFEDNDFLLVKYRDNVEQKCEILLELNRGDIPENELFGKRFDLITGVSSNQYAYPQLLSDIEANFKQNDLFEYVEVKEFSREDGAIYAKVDIKTKYDYKTEKKISI